MEDRNSSLSLSSPFSSPRPSSPSLLLPASPSLFLPLLALSPSLLRSAAPALPFSQPLSLSRSFSLALSQSLSPSLSARPSDSLSSPSSPSGPHPLSHPRLLSSGQQLPPFFFSSSGSPLLPALPSFLSLLSSLPLTATAATLPLSHPLPRSGLHRLPLTKQSASYQPPPPPIPISPSKHKISLSPTISLVLSRTLSASLPPKPLSYLRAATVFPFSSPSRRRPPLSPPPKPAPASPSLSRKPSSPPPSSSPQNSLSPSLQLPTTATSSPSVSDWPRRATRGAQQIPISCWV